MAGRYEKLFNLDERLYIPTSPVIIEAGALLKDNANNSVLAQLKIKNITSKIIKALTVVVKSYDTVGEPIGVEVEHQYLDLSIGRDNLFGTKEPITLADNKTRSFSVNVTNVVFVDNTTWENTNTDWTTIPQQEVITLDEIETASYHGFYKVADNKVVMDHEDLWLCTCGAVNHSDEEVCHHCGNKKEDLTTIDFEDFHNKAYYATAVAKAKSGSILDYEKAIKLLETVRLYNDAADKIVEYSEAIQKLKDKFEAEKKAKIKKGIIIGAVVLAFIIICMIANSISNASDYKKANALLEAQSYSEAAEIYNDLGAYKDSIHLMNLCDFHLEYDKMFDDGISSYDADDIIEDIDFDYPNLAEAKPYKSYCLALNEENVDNALQYYENAGDIADAKDRVEIIKKAQSMLGKYTPSSKKFIAGSYSEYYKKYSYYYNYTIKSVEAHNVVMDCDYAKVNVTINYDSVEKYPGSKKKYEYKDQSNEVTLYFKFDGTVSEGVTDKSFEVYFGEDKNGNDKIITMTKK